MLSQSSLRQASLRRSSSRSRQCPTRDWRAINGTIRAVHYQPDVPRDRPPRKGAEWLQRLISKFNPALDKSKTALVLDFEKPLINLDNRIKEVKKVAEENDVDVTEQIKVLEERSKQLRKETYAKLTAYQRLQVARHPKRPTTLDIVLAIADKFIELHGDRAGHDDKAIICGIGKLSGIPCMFIGHQKGRNTRENIERNFGMAQPFGFRKALRFMQHADKFGLPIITFVDTPGAYAGVKAEELGQGEAIAKNLREMFNLRVPVISVVIGEGGSGGALAINCANKVLIMENAVYYVASPEACAAILWKSRDKSPQAAEALKITATDLLEVGVVDEIIPEPLGGAHSDPPLSFPPIKEAIVRHLKPYLDMPDEDIKMDRHMRYRNFGAYSEFLVKGGKYKEEVERRRKAEGVYTAAGTWCVDEEEKEYIEKAIDYAERWEENIKGKEAWLNKPDVPEEEIDEAIAFLENLDAELQRIADLPDEGPYDSFTVRPIEVDDPRDENGDEASETNDVGAVGHSG